METSQNEMYEGLNQRVERLKIRHLRLLDMIARRGSLSAAAAALGISQPGATKLLHELEAALGLTLIERNARGGQLNAHGHLVLDRLRVALGAMDAAATALALGVDLPLLRVGLLPLVGIEALGRVVQDLLARRQLPRLVLQLGTVEQLVQWLRESEVDCVVGVLGGDLTPQALAPFEITPLWQQSTVVVAARDHPLARRRRVPLADLLDADWVLMPRRSASRKAFDRAFLGAGLVPPAARIETESFHIAMGLVAHTRMLAVVPIGAYRQQAAVLRRVAMAPAFAPSSVVMLTPKGVVPVLPVVALWRDAFMRVSASEAADVSHQL
jgi:DNA-binding transcriptional LysR family regulator